MRTLVVVAHPCDDSFTHAVARRTCDGLRRGGHHVDVIDLYALDIDPVMRAEEWQHYLRAVAVPDNDAAGAAASAPTDDILRAHADLVQRAEALVFVYPTWWSSVPAVMKGWVERVMRPGLAFRVEEGRVRPGLRHVRHLIGISTYGSRRTYVRLVNDNGRRLILRTLRVCTGRRTRTRWLPFYSIDTATPERRARFLDRVEASMAAL